MGEALLLDDQGPSELESGSITRMLAPGHYRASVSATPAMLSIERKVMLDTLKARDLRDAKEHTSCSCNFCHGTMRRALLDLCCVYGSISGGKM